MDHRPGLQRQNRRYIIFSSILSFFFEHSLRGNFYKTAFLFAIFCLHVSDHFSCPFPYFHLFYLFSATDTAAYLLEKALQVESVNPFPLIEAVYWLESAYVIEQLNATQLRAIRANYRVASSTGDSYIGSGNNGESGESSESVVKRVSNSVKKMIANTLSEEGDVEGSGAVHTPAHLLKNTGMA